MAVRSEFVKNVLTLMTGTAMGQGLALLLSPLLTRLFDPTQFSTFEQYAFLLSVFTVVVTGKFEFAVMHPTDREEARHIAGLSMRFAIYSCSALLILLALFGQSIASFLHNPDLGIWLWTLVPALFAVALFNTINFWFSRERNYKVAATARLIYSAAGEPIKILAGYAGKGFGGLIFGTVTGHIIAAWYSWKKFIQHEPRGLRELSKSRIKALASEHSDYPRYAVLGGVLNNLAQWAHVAVFTFFYGEKALIPIGLIALSRRIFFNPLGILSSSYGQVFYQRITEIESARELRSFYLKALFRFSSFAALLIILVQFLPTNTLGFIFGEKWTDALIYLKTLSFWYSLNFVIGTLSFIYYRLKLQWYTLVIDIFHFLIVILAFWWAWYSGQDELGAVKMMVIAKVIYLLLNGLAVIYFLNRNCRLNKN